MKSIGPGLNTIANAIAKKSGLPKDKALAMTSSKESNPVKNKFKKLKRLP